MIEANKNTLSNYLSPYLKHIKIIQVIGWSKETLVIQKKKEIILSIGYASCHWCHVMAHESFEDSETANL